MFKKSNKVKVLTILLFFTILLPMFTIQNDFSSKIETNENQEQINQEDDKIESSAIYTDEIHINGSATGIGAHNWTWAVQQGYCSGSGISSDPYIISNKIIDGGNLHSGIVIEDSRNAYFRIENNKIYDIGGPDSKSAGIKIYKSQYGTIRNNNITGFSDGNYGIHIVGYQSDEMYSSRDLNITKNYISNMERGIYIEENSVDIIVSENVAKYNSLGGIYIAKNCKRLTISRNFLSENNAFGLADTSSNLLGNPTNCNNIINNTIYKNGYGFYLSQTKYDKIGYNNISSNEIYGIYISGSQDNTIANNTIIDNLGKGILMITGPGGSKRNKIYRNYFLNNSEHAVENTNILYVWDYNNWSWWEEGIGSKVIGNYWDNYTGKDVDDDAIGDAPYNFTGNKDLAPIWNDGIEGDVIKINAWATGIGAHNWTWASGRFWCKGSGFISNPFVIGPNQFWDGVINGKGKTCITIGNTTEPYIGEVPPIIYFKIKDCTLINSSSSGEGIKITNSKYGEIINNIISSNNGKGIYFDHGYYINITGNIISNSNSYGIWLYNQSSYNNIRDNTISGNSEGTYLKNKCQFNNFTYNTFADNNKYGINLDSTCNVTTSYNNIFRTNGIAHVFDNALNNKWDWAGRGNDWDNYTQKMGSGAKDYDDDGIGDIPYNITGVAKPKDKFPIFNDGLEGIPLIIDGSATGVNAHNWTWASKRLFVSGGGSQWNPYVIENVKFDGYNTTSPITIKNSMFVYFKIENCTLKNIGAENFGSAGICLNKTNNGNLINNTYSTYRNWNYGIHVIDECEYINITNNLIEKVAGGLQFRYGIFIEDSCRHINIIGNIIRNNKYGIRIAIWCQYINIATTEIYSNANTGIILDNSCDHIDIFNNQIFYNGNGTIIENICNHNNIFNNTIKDNTGYGIYIKSSSGDANFIYSNNFINTTTPSSGTNARDDCISSTNYWYSIALCKGNYWSNYTEMGAGARDKDDDGIGDIPYNIRGVAKRQDIYPIWDDEYNGSRIVIDGNQPSGQGSWNWAASRTWCSGSGTMNDPYVIKNVKINGWQHGSCIYIYNSSVNFRIENSPELYNSSATESPEPAAGIRLINVSNATIENNNISNNGGYGIILSSTTGIGYCYNIMIKNNLIENNNESGIYINGWNCYNNLIENNTISLNHKNGIYVSDNSYRNIINKNTLNNNTKTGIFIKDGGWNGNTIVNNTIILGEIGVGIDGQNTVEITSNNISYASYYGIAVKNTLMTTIQRINISRNNIHDCGENGINFGWNSPQDSLFNRITENYIYNNGDAGISLTQCQTSIFSNNTLENNFVGISLANGDLFNVFNNNIIINNIDIGIAIFDLSCENNRIYNNNFTGNKLNGYDFGIDNDWYLGNIGNYWDDYLGKDKNDDELGDIGANDYGAYNISGLLNSKDRHPKWWDAPIIEILSPSNGERFSSMPPSFEIEVKEGKGHYYWYKIMQTGATSSYILLSQPQTVPAKIENTISTSIWNTLNGSWDGIIRFYVNDSKGYLTYQEVDIIKENVAAQIPTNPSSADDDDATTAEQQLEEDFPWWLQAILTGIISASAGLVLKISYSVHKRRKESYRKIAENMERIDNIEKFLKQKLGSDWNKFQEPWNRYQKQEISQKKLIKEGRKNVGKKFSDIFTKSKK